MAFDPLSSDQLLQVSAGQLAALISSRAQHVTAASYEETSQRDQAYINAIDEALHDAVDGHEVDEARAPAWLDGLARRELRTAASTSWSRDTFARIRLLERLGLVAPERDDKYVLAMVSSLGADKAAKLRSDPDLVETVLWRVFEVEGGGEVSLTNIDRFGGSGWRLAFLELTSDGTLDRARVLAECVGTLGRDFAAYRAGWYAATFLALEPSVEETAHLQPGLRRLLSADVPATVAFALKQLGRVQRAGLLDPEDTLAALPPATTVKAKGTALEALRLARAAGSDFPAAVVQVATAGLGHPHADVQRAAGELLSALGHRANLEAAEAELAPSVRQDLGIADRSPALPAHASATQVLAEAPAPVTSHELAERTAALLEDASDALELEAVLAALAEPGTELRLTPLRTRARAVLARGSATDDGDDWLPGQVARLVLTLLDEPVRPTTLETTAARFVARRLQELRTQTSPLLATPDLPGGWVSPAALVERLTRTSQPRHHDMIAALLRLHPDGRELHGTEGLPPAVAGAFRGVEPTRRRPGRSPSGPEAWWVAARRSRGPYAPEETPQVAGELRTHRWQDRGREGRFTYVEFTVTTPGTGGRPDDQPVERPVGRAVFRLGDWIPTLATVWPHDAEHFLALTAAGMLSATGSTDVSRDVPRVLDALARHPGRLGVLAVHVVAAGLSAAQREHRLHAVDAFLDLVPSGRLAAGDIAATLARHAEAWPAVRWVESLTAVSHGPGGAAAVVDVLTALLPQLPTNHRGLHGLLGVLRDESLRCARPVDDPRLRQWLGLLTGSSAAARTARQLLR